MNHPEPPTHPLSSLSEMAFIKQFVSKFSGATHLLAGGIESAGSFNLLSLRPYYDYRTEQIDMNRPNVFKVRVEHLNPTHHVDTAVLFKKTIGCADDIVMYAIRENTEARALGIDISIREALFEVARRPQTAYYRWILLTHPLLRGPVKNAVILENTVPESKSDQVLIVPLESFDVLLHSHLA